MEFQHQVEDGVAAATCGDLFLTVWRSPATTARWRWQKQFLSKLAQEKPEIVFLSLILSTSDPPDGPLRTEMQADFRELGPKLRRIVVVPLGSSMWMSVVRTIVRGLLILSGQARLQTIASTVDDGLDRVREVASVATPSTAELRRIVADLTKQLGVDSSAADATRA